MILTVSHSEIARGRIKAIENRFGPLINNDLGECTFSIDAFKENR
jgi:hypothetical protein